MCTPNSVTGYTCSQLNGSLSGRSMGHLVVEVWVT